MKIDEYNSFDEYYENNRLSKDTIIDYKKIEELIIDDYNYNLILIFLIKNNKIPISFYVTLSVEKRLSNHTSLLSVRFNKLIHAEEMFNKYKKIFKDKNEIFLYEEIKKDVEKNEWDLY